MSDVIKLMPDSLANQIAAGEVIQRPASVLKELVENSVDAGASKITVNIKDAGRTLIQVIDNGCGMSVTDARMSFERHATSKLTKAEDLFCIYTKGFRGEALASIAAVAEVELKTRRADDAIGTDVIINGSKFVSQTPVNTPQGTNFAIKSLFFNVPARRKFLKSNSTELQHIITEFQRIVLTHPMIEFSLYHNDNAIYILPKGSLKQRIIGVFGKSLNSEIIPVEIDTSIVKITGFTGKPSSSKRRNDKQFFFVNNRYMKNSYFHKAVALAYDKLTLPDCIPPYFLYLEVDPHTIDVNVHPAKTEINFENASDIFRLLQAGIKETLSKSDVTPAIDFDNQEAANIPYFRSDSPLPEEPQIDYDPNYNPFISTEKPQSFESLGVNGGSYGHGSAHRTTQYDSAINSGRKRADNWQLLYSNINDDSPSPTPVQSPLMQIGGKYIATLHDNGLMLIDQYRAHLRILYEKYLRQIASNADATQQLLYPQPLDLDAKSLAMAYDIRDELMSVGFDIDFPSPTATATLRGIPPFLEQNKAIDVLIKVIDSYRDEHGNISSSMKDILARSAARSEAVMGGRSLSNEEMQTLRDDLLATQQPEFSPDGRKTTIILRPEDLEKMFN
ncbi:MAG: DNA mismatch repair endonuclease MutL [Bacteroidales bacterium]|nr:DNA mismatch repair endonuclease MutL [Bacteroidales bacterium]